MRAKRPDGDGARALDELLGAYWEPVHAFYRRLGADRETAADLTQGLFTDLLARGDFATPDPGRGRFRAWLRTCARHWWNNQRERAAAQKRGGGREVRSLAHDDVEQWLRSEPVERIDAEAVFERRWAATVITRAVERLEGEEAAAGRRDQFAVLRGVLDGGPPGERWGALAVRLDTTEGALKVAAHRLKARFRAALEAEVRDTLPDEVAPGDEIRALLEALQASARGIPRDSR